MILGNQSVRRLDNQLAGLSAVDPASVSGYVMIAGKRYPYRDGVLQYQGQIYAVSDDKDFIISSLHVPIGAIINGVLIPLDQLLPVDREKVRRKYGY